MRRRGSRRHLRGEGARPGCSPTTGTGRHLRRTGPREAPLPPIRTLMPRGEGLCPPTEPSRRPRGTPMRGSQCPRLRTTTTRTVRRRRQGAHRRRGRPTTGAHRRCRHRGVATHRPPTAPTTAFRPEGHRRRGTRTAGMARPRPGPTTGHRGIFMRRRRRTTRAPTVRRLGWIRMVGMARLHPTVDRRLPGGGRRRRGGGGRLRQGGGEG